MAHYYDVHLNDGRVIDGVKFTPPKHWVIHNALTIQTVDGPARDIDHIAPGNRLHAINGQRIHEQQFAQVVEHLRSIAGPLSLTIEDAKPRLASAFRWGHTAIQVDTIAWTVQLPHGTIVFFSCLLLDLLREADIGLTAGDTLVAVNGKSVVALSDRTLLQQIQDAKQQPVMHLEWINHTPSSHSHRARQSRRTAWAILAELHVEPTARARRCCLCCATFGVFKHKKSCTVCGQVVCSTCQAKCVAVVSSIHSYIKYRSCLRCANMASSSR